MQHVPNKKLQNWPVFSDCSTLFFSKLSNHSALRTLLSINIFYTINSASFNTTMINFLFLPLVALLHFSVLKALFITTLKIYKNGICLQSQNDSIVHYVLIVWFHVQSKLRASFDDFNISVLLSSFLATKNLSIVQDHLLTVALFLAY